MANEASFAELFKSIEEAKISATYEDAIFAHLKIVRKLATMLLGLDPDATLPRPPKNVNMNTNLINPLFTNDQGKVPLQDCAYFAYGTTAGLAGAINGLKEIPPDQQNRMTRQTNFSIAAQKFVDAWSFWFPTLQSFAGGDANNKVREAQEEAMRDAKAIKSILADSQEAVKKIGAGKHAEAFSLLSDEYRNRAW
jgi:hypothetical protein